jgi:hypothetical protein
MTNGPIEPAADLRTMANMIRQAFLALLQEGFTEHQALVIVGQLVTANSSGGGS